MEKEAGDHRIPAVDRAIRLLEILATGGPASIRDLSATMRIPRSTVYRVLNTLAAHAVVVREADGTYACGPKLLRLARGVPSGVDLASLARPHLDGLARSLGTSAKLSVLDGDAALVVAVGQSPGAYSIATQVGRRFPLHAGAASKVLAAALPRPELDRLIARGLRAITAHSITAAAVFRRELAEVRVRGWAEDRGEFADGIGALAAPVHGADGAVVAALSVPFLLSEAQDGTRLRDAVTSAARAMTLDLGGPPTPA